MLLLTALKRNMRQFYIHLFFVVLSILFFSDKDDRFYLGNRNKNFVIYFVVLLICTIFALEKQCSGLPLASFNDAGGKSGQHRALRFLTGSCW